MKTGIMGMLLGSLVTVGLAQEPEELKFEKAPSWDVTCEVFSLPLSEVAKLKRAGKSDAEDYAALVKQVESGKAGQEEFLMMRVTAGTPVILEEIEEMIYATEFDPPEMPNQIGKLGENLEAAKNLITPANPTSFETKKVGATLRVDLQPEREGGLDLGFDLNLVSFLGRQTWGQGVAEVEMPRFATQELVAKLRVKRESTTLVGSISPPTAMQPEKGEREVWLAYVTISEAKE